MSKITTTIDPNNDNHIKIEYVVDKVFLNFPNQQKAKTIVNGTVDERTVLAGTMMGLTTADQAIAQPVESDATDGSEVPYGFLLYDTVIAAGASEEVEALIGWGDDKSSIFEDMVVLEKSGDTLDTVMTGAATLVLGQSIRNALLNSNSNIKIEPAADNISDFKDAQV